MRSLEEGAHGHGGANGLAIAAAAIVLAGCGGNVETPSDGGTGRAARGGTLTYYLPAALVDHLDPQRTYNGVVLSSLGRTVYRSWVTFPVSENVEKSTTTVPDLATDTGTSENGGRTWRFTLKDGGMWEDGRPVICEDFKYGASREFATTVITGGPSNLQTYLDIPIDERTGLPAYEGPYTKMGQDLYDKAVTCDGRTITYRFRKPWAEFPLAVASLHMMDPYRQDKDQGRASSFEIFSNGPYRLEGAWEQKKGGTLVRNDQYDASTDSTDVRKALPDRIVLDISRSPEQVADLLIADRGADRAAVSAQQIPRAYHGRITGDIAERTVTVASPYTRFLMPNFRRLTNPQVRQALAASVDVTAWVAAGGGAKAYQEATDVVHPAVRGHQKDLFPGGSGDPDRARQLLAQAGVQTPYPITFAYAKGTNPPADRQAAALEHGWERAGFEVTLNGIAEEEYYNVVGKPDQEADIVASGWGADWPSAITVTAQMFDSRRNLTRASNGQDLGAYQSREFEALVDEAEQSADPDLQTQLLQAADQVLARHVAYIPLDIPVFYLLRGSAVTGYLNTAASNSYPDLGAIGVR